MGKRTYSLTAKLYDIFVEPFNQGLRNIGLKMCPPADGLRVLEVGCGPGENLQNYLNGGCRVFGVELSNSMVAIARKKLGQRADLCQTDATHLPCRDNSFDIAIAMLTLHEMDAPVRSRVLDEMLRVLKPDGCLLLIDFYVGHLSFPKGWLKKIPVFLFELGGGKRHFCNYRQFLASGGLQQLIEEKQIDIQEEKIVGGGNFVLITGEKTIEPNPKD